jgi:hypothetical protein
VILIENVFFLEVEAEIRAHMARDKNTFLQEETASVKHKLMSVGGCADTPWKEGHDFDSSRYIHQENYWDMDVGIKKDIWSVMEDFVSPRGARI